MHITTFCPICGDQVTESTVFTDGIRKVVVSCLKGHFKAQYLVEKPENPEKSMQKPEIRTK